MPSRAALTEGGSPARGEKLALGGVLGLSALIASCCVGPALFLLFGVSVGVLSRLSALEPLRPYLIAAGGGLLAWAGWRLYRRPAPAAAGAADAACAEEACGPGAAGPRRMRRLFWVAVGIYTLAIAWPVLFEALYG